MDEKSRWQAPFYIIWTGQAVSMLGSWLVRFGIVWWLTEESGSAAVLSGATLVTLLPSIVVSPLIGPLIDRWNRRLIMIVADTSIAVLTGLLAFLFWRGSVQIWQIYAILLARAVGGCFQDPAMMASTSLMVPKAQLTRVAGMNQTLFGIIMVGAPALGAFLLESTSIEVVLLVDVLSAIPAILPLLFIAVPQPEAPAAGTRRSSMFASMREGLAYLWNWKGMLVFVSLWSFTGAFAWPWRATEPLLIRDHFGRGAAGLALSFSVIGIVRILGGIVISAWGGFSRRMNTIRLGLILLAVADLLRGLAPANAFWLFLIGVGIYGLGLGLSNAPFRAVLQSSVEPAKQGRVFSLVASLTALMSPVGLVVLGPLADVIGVQSILLGRAASYLLTLAACAFIASVRDIEDGPPEALVVAESA